MLKVLLVDDEPNVRQGVKMMIPWAEIGCEVIGEADDGDEGLSRIMNMNPDIVVADIKMPGKSGIEMTQAAKQMGFKGKVIILSGYSDFSYAKEAIALGVEAFILKPVDEDELTEAIKAAGEKILKERENKVRRDIGKEYLSEQMIKGVFFGSDSYVAQFEERYQEPGFITAIAAASETDSEEKMEIYRLVRGFYEDDKMVHIIQVDITGVLGLLFRTKPAADVIDSLRRLRIALDGKIILTMGDYVVTAGEIKRSFEQAEYLFRNRFIYEGPEIITTARINRRPETENDYASKLCAFMEINDTDKLEMALDKFGDSLRVYGTTAERARVACITLMLDVRSGLVRTIADKKPETLITDEFIASLEEVPNLSEMMDKIKEKLIGVSNECFARSTRSNMERVVQYIKQNYDKELRLEMLAGIFDYNSAYLGKVFRQYTGENFNNFLDNIRITEAKRLLSEEDYKVYEVAEMVGYSNINYFHNKFKKSVGMSPLSFKRQYGHDE